MSRRITLNLTTSAEAELDRLANETGLSEGSVIQRALTALRILWDAECKGEHVTIEHSAGGFSIVNVFPPGENE